MIPVFVISLIDSKERRDRISKKFSNLNINFEFIDAVDGRKFDVTNQAVYDSKKRLRSFGKHLNGGEIGCLLSHKKTYQHIADQKIKRSLILEDDVILRDDFFTVLEKILNVPIPFDMIRFLDSPKLTRLKLRRVYKLDDAYYLDRHNGMPGGAHATLVTLNGAKKILKHLEYTAFPIDALLGRNWKTGCHWYTVRPGLAAQDRELESAIGESRFDNQKDIAGLTKALYPLTRGWFKFSETCCKKYWYAKTYFRDKRYANF